MSVVFIFIQYTPSAKQVRALSKNITHFLIYINFMRTSYRTTLKRNDDDVPPCLNSFMKWKLTQLRGLGRVLLCTEFLL